MAKTRLLIYGFDIDKSKGSSTKIVKLSFFSAHFLVISVNIYTSINLNTLVVTESNGKSL